MTENDSEPSPNGTADENQQPQLSGPRPSVGGDEHSAPKTRGGMLRFAALGTELAGYTLAFAGIGYLLDSARGNNTAYGAAFGTLIGFALGMARFIREVQTYNEK